MEVYASCLTPVNRRRPTLIGAYPLLLGPLVLRGAGRTGRPPGGARACSGLPERGGTTGSSTALRMSSTVILKLSG
jgi:hypothetical protein